MLPGIDAINSAIASTAETNAAKPRWQGATGLPESERTHPTQPTQLTQEMKPEAPAEEERPPPSETDQPLRLMHPPAVPEGFYGAPQQSRPTVAPPPSHTAEQAAWLEMQGRVNPTPPGPVLEQRPAPPGDAPPPQAPATEPAPAGNSAMATLAEASMEALAEAQREARNAGAAPRASSSMFSSGSERWKACPSTGYHLA